MGDSARVGGWKPTVLLEPANPHDLNVEDLTELLERIEASLPDVKAEIAYEDQVGAGGPWMQVLHLWVAVTFVEAVGYGILVDTCKEWLHEQFRTVHGRKRGKVLIIHELETGREVASLRLDSDADAFVAEIVEDVPRKRPRGRYRRGT